MRGIIESTFTRLCTAFILVAACAVSAQAATQTREQGFVEVAEGRELYVDYIKPAPGKPTVLLLNGLTYRVGSWDSFVTQLKKSGVGILRYDPMGHGQTLLKYAPVTAAIDYKDQVEDLHVLLQQLEINEPVHVVGLSYGGAIGMYFSKLYPEYVASLILMAPFVAPLENQDTWIKYQILQTRLMNPMLKATDDELYDYFLKLNVYTTYPYAEPVVLENPYKLEATFRLVQGIRKFLAKDIVAKLPKDKVHLVVAGSDQYLPAPQLEAFWNQLPTGMRASRIFIEGSEHKIPEAVPTYAAAWVNAIVKGDSRISHGRTFKGYPWRGTAESDSTKIEGLK